MSQLPRMNRLLRVAAGAFALAALIGCGATAVTEGGKDRPKVYREVISLSPGTSEIIKSTVFENILKGRTASDDWPQSVEAVPIVASVKPDYEAIALIKPDLIVYDALLYNEGDIDKMKAQGADTFAFQSNTLDGFIEELYMLASKLGSETNTITYVENIIRERNTALGEKGENAPKAAVVLPGPGGQHLVAGVKSFVADVVRNSGAEPVGPDADRFVPLSPESFVSQNPAVIVIPFNRVANDEAASRASALQASKRLMEDPRLKNVQAIANGQIIAIDEDVLTRRGYRVNQLIEGIRRRLPKN